MKVSRRQLDIYNRKKSSGGRELGFISKMIMVLTVSVD
jgi:hypothetical protein